MPLFPHQGKGDDDGTPLAVYPKCCAKCIMGIHIYSVFVCVCVLPKEMCGIN